jgi:hypothetical protein
VRLRKARGTLLLFSLITIASWLLATNHCAIARELMTSATNESVSLGHEHCPRHGAKPDGKEDDPRQMACCWALKVSLNSEHTVVSYDGAFLILQWFLLELIKSNFGSEASLERHQDHGPPKAASFAEQVLQRCILSNAPPVLS